MDYRGKLLTAPLIWFDEKLQRGVQIRLSDAGKIVAIGDGIAKPGEEVHEIQNAVSHCPQYHEAIGKLAVRENLHWPTFTASTEL